MAHRKNLAVPKWHIVILNILAHNDNFKHNGTRNLFLAQKKLLLVPKMAHGTSTKKKTLGTWYIHEIIPAHMRMCFLLISSIQTECW